MTTPTSKQQEATGTALLAELDGEDPLAVAFAIRRCAERLRAAEWDMMAIGTLIAKLVALAEHESARVKQAVAEASPYLPEPVFQQLRALLATERNPYVVDALQRADKRRTTLKRAAVKDEEHDARVDRLYRAAEKKGFRLGAQRIAAHETEYFVRRLHHEAGASFAPIKDAVAKLRAGVTQPELRAQIDKLEQRVDGLRHLLDQARNHARPLDPCFRRENLRALVADEAEALASRFPERAARIAVDLGGVDGTVVLDGDANFLKQAFANILKNAVESYDARPDAAIAIRVSTKMVASSGSVALSFADQGCGMHEDQAEHAFVPFGSSKPGGTGFGLFLARKVAHQVHGGDLKLASTLGAGTTVTMILPLRQEGKR